MATYTSHYNLKKPATSDKIRIADFNGNADIIDGQMYDNETLGAQLKADIGIVENTNTASHNISEGQYVIWKGSLYVASSAISSGATLSSANLTAVSGGGLNALNGNITNLITRETISASFNSDGVYVTNVDFDKAITAQSKDPNVRFIFIRPSTGGKAVLHAYDANMARMSSITFDVILWEHS